jgi:phenylacetate-CoA ligase
MVFLSDLRSPAQPGSPDDPFGHALSLFHRTARNVPAYAKYLADHHIAVESILTRADFAAVPPMTKQSYLRQHPLPDLVWQGDMTRAATWSTSSGSSGVPTYWPRAAHAQAESVELHDRIFREVFRSHERSTLLVVGFAMGNWIGGTYTYSAAVELSHRGHRLSVIAPGIDVDTILANIAALGPGYEQVVLAGYPPFIKDVLDAADQTVLRQDIRLLMAGESISEDWRDHVIELLGRPEEPERTCLIYGTADMGMVGHETPTTIAIRRAAMADPVLGRALFGDAVSAPTLVEYEPMFRFTEVDDRGRLLYTSEGVVPLIRYRINDEGTVWTANELECLLRDHGCTVSIRSGGRQGGYIALRSRSDIAASLYAVNIYPDNVRPAIEAELGRLSGKFTLLADTTDGYGQQLTLHAELARGVTASLELQEHLRARAAQVLERSNSEYRALRSTKGPEVNPVVVLHEFGNGQFAYDVKHRWAEHA